MKISRDTFRFYDECVSKFGVDIDKNVVFTYGDTIHARCYISDDLYVHEETHSKQQEEIGKDMWWRMYLSNPDFRLRQEAEAYRNQYRFFKTNDRERNAKFLYKIATDLSGRTYGNICTFAEAKKLIQ